MRKNLVPEVQFSMACSQAYLSFFSYRTNIGPFTSQQCIPFLIHTEIHYALQVSGIQSQMPFLSNIRNQEKKTNMKYEVFSQLPKALKVDTDKMLVITLHLLSYPPIFHIMLLNQRMSAQEEHLSSCTTQHSPAKCNPSDFILLQYLFLSQPHSAII